jgi:hypothetical protein
VGVAEIGCVAVNWIDLAKEGNKRRDRMNALMKFQFPKCWEFLV